MSSFVVGTPSTLGDPPRHEVDLFVLPPGGAVPGHPVSEKVRPAQLLNDGRAIGVSGNDDARPRRLATLAQIAQRRHVQAALIDTLPFSGRVVVAEAASGPRR